MRWGCRYERSRSPSYAAMEIPFPLLTVLRCGCRSERSRSSSYAAVESPFPLLPFIFVSISSSLRWRVATLSSCYHFHLSITKHNREVFFISLNNISFSLFQMHREMTIAWVHLWCSYHLGIWFLKMGSVNWTFYYEMDWASFDPKRSGLLQAVHLIFQISPWFLDFLHTPRCCYKSTN